MRSESASWESLLGSAKRLGYRIHIPKWYNKLFNFLFFLCMGPSVGNRKYWSLFILFSITGYKFRFLWYASMLSLTICAGLSLVMITLDPGLIFILAMVCLSAVGYENFNKAFKVFDSEKILKAIEFEWDSSREAFFITVYHFLNLLFAVIRLCQISNNLPLNHVYFIIIIYNEAWKVILSGPICLPSGKSRKQRWWLEGTPTSTTIVVIFRSMLCIRTLKLQSKYTLK